MKTSLIILVSFITLLSLTGCGHMMPSWFQKEMVVSRDDPGTKIYCDAVNQTNPQIKLDAIFINDVNVGMSIGDKDPLDWGQKYSFQIGYELFQNSAQDNRGRANTGGGYSELAMYANVYAVGHLDDGTQIMVYPRGSAYNGNMRLTSKLNNSLIFERYNIAQLAPKENPHKPPTKNKR